MEVMKIMTKMLKEFTFHKNILIRLFLICLVLLTLMSNNKNNKNKMLMIYIYITLLLLIDSQIINYLSC